jgi:phosphate transport system protein
MTKHFDNELAVLKRQLFSLSAMVEESLRLALRAVMERSEDLSERVIAGDEEIDRKEVEIEEECLKTLALYQPVAADLRYVIVVLKMTNDLERIGDLAVNIAHRARSLMKLPKSQAHFDFSEMGSLVQAMLKKALQSLLNSDTQLAREVCQMDDGVDSMNRDMHDRIRKEIRSHIEDLESLTYYMSVSRNLERIADHTTNIAEDVIYLKDGIIVRHGNDLGNRDLGNRGTR